MASRPRGLDTYQNTHTNISKQTRVLSHILICGKSCYLTFSCITHCLNTTYICCTEQPCHITHLQQTRKPLGIKSAREERIKLMSCPSPKLWSNFWVGMIAKGWNDLSSDDNTQLKLPTTLDYWNENILNVPGKAGLRARTHNKFSLCYRTG